jgi:hypothetical protein
MPLASCASRTCALWVFTGVVKRGSLSLRQRAAPLPHPYGLFPINAHMLGEAYGAIRYLRNMSY